MESSSSSSSSSGRIPSSSSSSSSILVTVIVTLLLLLFSSIFYSTTYHHNHHSNSNSNSSSSSSFSSSRKPQPQPPLINPIIKNTCTNTLYPSLCFHTLSAAFPLLATTTTTHDDDHHHIINQNTTTTTTTTTALPRLLLYAIQRTIKRVTNNRFKIISRFSSSQDLMMINFHQETNWVLDNCIELLDQTLYELQEAITLLYHHDHHDHDRLLLYANIKTLLSAAMTNENTCIDGFSDMEPITSSNKRYIHKSLTPIMRMISNCLAIIKYMETIGDDDVLSISDDDDDHQPWMTSGDRKLMMETTTTTTTTTIINPSVVVALDGSGNYTNISEAVRMAPNRGTNRYVILIKAGIYIESVVIPRHKVNIMLVGQGMNSTLIMASKNFVDGFPTFTSATLTVVGNRFLARDLTIINTSGPEKHQAVAVRVTSNAAFYRCQFISNQDTLYAHSLSQLYRECAIHGTIDFIFGNAAAIFQRCLILVRKPIPGQKNVITAQGRLDPYQNTGISLQGCTILAAPDFPIADRPNFSTFLGRPWRNYSRTIVMKSYLGDLIDPQGWCAWNEYSNLSTVDYIEYMNFGPGADTRNRVQWAGYQNNSSRGIDKFTVKAFLHGANEWLKSADLPLLIGPSSTDYQTDMKLVGL